MVYATVFRKKLKKAILHSTWQSLDKRSNFDLDFLSRNQLESKMTVVKLVTSQFNKMSTKQFPVTGFRLP